MVDNPMNIFKEKLLTEIIFHGMSSSTTDARSEAKDLMEFIKCYPYFDVSEKVAFEQSYVALSESDYKEVEQLLKAQVKPEVCMSLRSFRRMPPLTKNKLYI